MPSDHVRFSPQTQNFALERQKFRCAMCGERMTAIGNAGAAYHPFGEPAQGHHVIPHKMGGPVTVENCVVLCRSCHLSAHQGGRWRDVSIYDDLDKLPLPQKIKKIAAMYMFYKG